MRSGLIHLPRVISSMLLGVLSIGAAYPNIARQTSGYAPGIGVATEGYGRVGYEKELDARRLWNMKKLSLRRLLFPLLA